MYGFSTNLKTTMDDPDAKVRAALMEEGFGVLTEIDVQKIMKAKLDISRRGYKILGACNPDFAHQAIDAGADAVIGHHTHLFSGIERYGKGVIVYSLGNFLFGRDRNRRASSNAQWLLKLYVEANQLLTKKEDETPEQTAQREAYDAERREVYRRYDAGDPYVRELWRVMREWSLDELRDVLELLDIRMDVWFYESEADEPSKAIVDELIQKGIADDERLQGGPVIVKIDEKLGLKKEKYRTNVILRSDGTSLYLTKDLALAKIKFEQYHVDRSIYVVDVGQSLHLQQAFAILKLWGFPQAEKCYHLAYGIVTLPEGRMSSRKGQYRQAGGCFAGRCELPFRPQP